ncbi:hypothetical protein OUHCRE19_22170 [Enterobacter asburiae]
MPTAEITKVIMIYQQSVNNNNNNKLSDSLDAKIKEVNKDFSFIFIRHSFFYG